jgi:carotenoid cleavage dioxygenase-like enzyme
MTAVRPRVAAPVDAASNPHLSGVFAPIVDEVDVGELRVEGELPHGIDGDYLRNGPNPRFTPIGGYLYPIDGDGMLHRVRISDGRARYTNRFVRTPSLTAEETAGRALWPGFQALDCLPGPDLVGPELAHSMKDLPDVNVVRHGGRLLALAESANPFLMSPELATLGRETFGGMLPAGITAHPKIDPATGEMVVFCYGLSEPYLTWSVIGPDGAARRAPTPVEGVRRPTMIHDMALTPTYVVLVLAPFYFDMRAAMQGGSPLSWQPQDGTSIVLIPRDGGAPSWVTTEAFWLWHTANAHDEVGPDGARRVVMDYVRHGAPGALLPGSAPQTSLARLTVDVAAGRVSHGTLAEVSLEFPRIDDRVLTGAHTVIGAAVDSGRRALPAGDADALCWYDTVRGSYAQWDGGSLSLGEQTFIPQPGSPDPAAGWWTTIATDRTDLRSRLLVFPAADPASGPIATVHLPQRVPAGLHGAWLPTEE